MSTARNSSLAADDLPPSDDPYLYGWRYVYHTRPDGTEVKEQVPLTRLDVLHPREGDVIVESDLHDKLCAYLANVLRDRFADDPTTLVLSDTGVYWDGLEFENHSPDLAVIFGVKETRVEWSSFDVAEHGVRPRLIVELVSPHVRTNDVVNKMREYHIAEVPTYVIADRRRVGGPWTIKGFEYAPDGYVPLPNDDRGRLWLADVGMWLGAEGPRVLLHDGQTGAAIGDYTEVNRQRKQQQARADAESQRREVAEARVRELETEIARLRGQNPG